MNRRNPRQRPFLLLVGFSTWMLTAHCSSGTASGEGSDGGEADASELDAKTVVDAGPLPDTSTSRSGTYFAVCLPTAAGKDVAMTFRFKADAVHVTGASPTLSLQLTPLPGGSVKVSEALTPTFPTTPVVASLDKGGGFKWNVGSTTTFPAEANPITGVAVALKNVVLTGYVSSDPTKFCAGIDGYTDPSGIFMTAATDICLFQKVSSTTGAMPVPAAADFVCP